MSRQLSESFQLLEARMNSLQGELEWVSAQRLQELAEKERLASRLQNLLDVLPAGIVVVDGAGRVRDVNPVAVALLGEPLLGELWRAVIARAFAPRHDDGHEVSLRATVGVSPSPPARSTVSRANWCCSMTSPKPVTCKASWHGMSDCRRSAGPWPRSPTRSVRR
ncbi:PAS domain-containing protein [Pseudomonas psychrotolerans]|nr:PAS domain-containing protein [Pseudomonas psychrotolerans]